MPRQTAHQIRIIAAATKLSHLLSDGKPHSNAEIKNKCGLPWDHPLTIEVRRYLRDHGEMISPHVEEGFWVLSHKPADAQRHRHRRVLNHYREACRNARAVAGELSRHPTDMALSMELNEWHSSAYFSAARLGVPPAQVAADLTPQPTPAGFGLAP